MGMMKWTSQLLSQSTIIAATFWKKRATRVSLTCFQAPVTPSQRNRERNENVPRWPGSFRPPRNLLIYLPVSEMELRELESWFMKLELNASSKTWS
jgi:hypothetical protein